MKNLLIIIFLIMFMSLGNIFYVEVFAVDCVECNYKICDATHCLEYVCTICGKHKNNVACGGWHSWDDVDKWVMVDNEKHSRTCSVCGISQTLDHDFFYREAIDGNIEEHYKVCSVCRDDENNSYKVYERHIDTEVDGRGNGYCDTCGKELWRVSFSTTEATNKDVTVKVEIFSDYEDKMKLPYKMVDTYGNEFFENDGMYTINKNGKYKFSFESPDTDVVVEVNNISNDIYGKIFITPNTPTDKDVTLKLVVGKNGIDKTFDLSLDNIEWENNVSEIERKVSSNGVYTFYARDSLGNNKVFSYNVNNIVSGFASVTTAYDVFENGYIFTDILINVNQEWIAVSSLMNCIDASISKTSVGSSDDETLVDVNKVQITDELGNVVNGNILKAGVYYVRVAIGGNGVFTEGTYLVELENIELTHNGTEILKLTGKNRIEVVVQSLNDLT